MSSKSHTILHLSQCMMLVIYLLMVLYWVFIILYFILFLKTDVHFMLVAKLPYPRRVTTVTELFSLLSFPVFV